MGRKKNRSKEVTDDFPSVNQPIRSWAAVLDNEEAQSSNIPSSPSADPEAQKLLATLTNSPQTLALLKSILKEEVGSSTPSSHPKTEASSPAPLHPKLNEIPKPKSSQLVVSQLPEHNRNVIIPHMDKGKGIISSSSKTIEIINSESSSKNFVSKEEHSQLILSQSKLPQSGFFEKERFQNVVSVEKGFYSSDPQTVLLNIFPKGWHFKPWDLSKPHSYYRSILELTDSIKIKDHFLEGDTICPAYSTCKILSVLPPVAWGQDLHKSKSFPAMFKTSYKHSRTFSYWDYQQAWFNTFLIQNDKFSHSWLFHFEASFNGSTVPSWFSHWWSWYGADPRILPPHITESYSFWHLNSPPPKDYSFSDPLFYFCSFHKIPWVTQWKYSFHSHGTSPFMLIRKFKTKWWTSYQIPKSILKPQIQQWIAAQQNMNPILPTPDSGSDFFARKALAQAQLAQARNEEEYFALMGQFLNSASAASSSYDSDDPNEVNLGSM